jgi:hypothetical protein
VSLTKGDLFSDPYTLGQEQLQAFADAIRFEDGASARRVRSDLYGYTIDIPRDWTVSRARQRWTGFGSWAEGATDRLIGQGPRAAVTIDIVGRTLSDELTGRGSWAAWLSKVVPLPPAVHGTLCRWPGRTLPLASAMEWGEGKVAGHDALVRRGCGAAQAAIRSDGAVWVVSMSTDRVRADADLEAFRSIVDTFRIDRHERPLTP